MVAKVAALILCGSPILPPPPLFMTGRGGSEASMGKWMICRRREVLQIQVKAIGKEGGDNKWTRVCYIVSS